MLRNFRGIASIAAGIGFSLCVFAQNNVAYKDVILDGKPAKLNVATGEITLLNIETKMAPKAIAKPADSITEVLLKGESSDFHIVKEGETLLDIANTYKVSLTALKKANNLKTTLINKDQSLRIRNLDSITLKQNLLPTSTNESTSNLHSVERGETLYSLAKRYGLSLNELKRLNGLNSNVIVVGQKLRVHNDETTIEVRRASIWIVSSGETLYSIAKKNGTTVEAIKSLNGLTGNLIRAGQKLQLK